MALAERELTVLWRVAEAFNRCGDVREGLGETLARVCELLGLAGGWAWVRTRHGGPFELAATHRLPAALAAHPERMRGSLGCTCLGRYAERPTGRAANVGVLECSRLAGVLPPGVQPRAHASVPLLAGGRLLGVMNVLRHDWAPLREDELRLLLTVGHQAALACERALLAEEATDAARLQERNALARDIHDSLAQDLAGLVLQLEAAEAAECAAVEAGGAGECLPHLRRALELAQAAMAEARRSVVALRAGADPAAGRSLADELDELAQRTERTAGTAVCVRLPRRAPVGAPAAAILQVAREAVSNAVRHGRARHVEIAVRRRGGRLLAAIRDDGRGFTASRAAGRGHFGLSGMRERARAAGGRLYVRSRPGAGTFLTLSLPEPARAAATPVGDPAPAPQGVDRA